MRARFAGIQGIVCTDFASEGAADRAREFYTRAALQAGWGSVDALFGFAPPALSRRNDQRGCDEHLFFDRGARDGAPVRSTLNMMLVDDPGCRSSGQIGGRR